MLALFRSHAVELAQPFSQCCLTLRRELLKCRIVFQGFFLLGRRNVLLFLQPFTGFAFLGVISLLGLVVGVGLSVGTRSGPMGARMLLLRGHQGRRDK